MDPITLLVIIGSAAAVGWYALSDGDQKSAPKAQPSPEPAPAARRPSLPAGKVNASPAALAAAKEQIKAAAASAAGREKLKIGSAPPPGAPFISMLIGSAVRVTGGASGWIGKIGTVIAEDPVSHMLTLAMAADSPTGEGTEFALAAPIQVARANVVPLSGGMGAATLHGIVEPEVIGISESEAKSYNTGEAIAHTTGQTLSAAAYGSTVPIIGTIAGAIYGFFKGLGESISSAVSETDDDRRRFLYEVGVWPLRRARVKHDVSARDYRIIQHARILEQAPKEGFGLQTIRGWLTESKEASKADPTRNEKAQRGYFARLAVAYLAQAHEQAKKGAPDPIAMPTSRALVLRSLGRFPVQSALDTFLRANPATVRAIRHDLATHHGAWHRFSAWVTSERHRAALRTPNPLAALAAPDAKPLSLPAGPVKAHHVAAHPIALPAGPVGPARKDS